jgi:hypothetical protein
MKKYKGLFFGIILLALFAFFFSLIVPTRFGVSKEVPASPNTLKAYLLNLENWNQWYTPLVIDTNIEPLYSKNPIGKNAFVKYGDNTLTITDVKDSIIFLKVQSASGKSMKGRIIIFEHPNALDTSVVSWEFETTTNKWLPWQRFGGIALEKVFKPEMKNSLTRLNDALNGGLVSTKMPIVFDKLEDTILIKKEIKIKDSNWFVALKKETAIFRTALENEHIIAKGQNINCITNYGLNKKTYVGYLLAKMPNKTQFNISTLKRNYNAIYYTNREGVLNLPAVKPSIEKLAAENNVQLLWDLAYVKCINIDHVEQNKPPIIKLVVPTKNK